ncbi:hypothetical protein [Neptunicella sp.]|uniref:hypothetical protein n=1 Tax=Neptunicella sp. TaxID=2125986 RepID=UPI003F68D7E6
MFNDGQKMLYNKASHNAFTDLCVYRQQLYCCFRAAQDHISPDGNIVVLHLGWQGEIQAETKIRMPGCDLRDPKLSVSADGKLILLAYGRHYDQQHKFLYSQPYVWFSTDGNSWSCAKPIGQKNWWLWRLSWYGDKALGFAYNRRQQTLALYAGNPLRTFEKILPEAFSQRKNKLGYPNESDICFNPDGTAYAIIRRDADSGSAQLGIAKPPYKQWRWHNLDFYLGGPAMLLINQQQAVLAGRIWQPSGPKTALINLDLGTFEAKIRQILPSDGDCSYPGLVKQDNQLYVSYYSSHINQQSAIYLHRINVE